MTVVLLEGTKAANSLLQKQPQVRTGSRSRLLHMAMVVVSTFLLANVMPRREVSREQREGNVL
jgi:hypothetical protein